MGYKKRVVAKTTEIIENMPENMPETVPEPVPEPVPETPEIDDAMKRKLEIAEKRRASLALARTKIIPKATLKKQAEDAVKNATDTIKDKDEVIKIKQEETDAMRLKYERDRVKQLEDSLLTLQKLIGDKPSPTVSAPIPIPEPVKYKRPSRSKLAIVERQAPQDIQPKQIIPKKSIEPKIVRPSNNESLIDKSYGEQLQERLRTQAINRIMNDTFGGF
jgi:hypothetical protein